MNLRLMLALSAAGLLATGCQTARPLPVSARPAPAASGLVLGELPRQQLELGACALFLWQAGPPPRLLVMTRVSPPIARIVIGGAIVDLPRIEASGVPVRGVAPHARYSDGSRSITLDLSIEERPDLADGAMVPSGSLQFERAGGDAMAASVSGMIACR